MTTLRHLPPFSSNNNRASRQVLVAMMPLTMAVSTLPLFALAVVASELQGEFGLSRLDLGVIGAVNTGVGALLSPACGRFSEHAGARNAVAATLLSACVASIVLALAPTFTFLIAGSALAGVAQGLGNPATNLAILGGVSENKRGVVIGAKQSGVQIAVVIAGIAIPLLSDLSSWRAGMWMIACLAIAVSGGVHRLPASTARANPAERRSQRLPLHVSQVAIFAFLLGIVGGGLGRFLPLFAEEAVGLSLRRAGQVFAIQGIVAVPARLAAGVLLDRGFSSMRMLMATSALGSVSLVVIAASSVSRPNLLWLGTVLAGLTLGTWNTPANLSVVKGVELTGRATGRLMLGFLLGLTIGGPLLGWIVDQRSYSVAWLGCGALSALASVLVSWKWRDRTNAST